MDLSHEEADVDQQIAALEVLPGYVASKGDERLVLNQIFNLIRRVDDLDVKQAGVRILKVVLAKEREGILPFSLNLLSCLQLSPASLKLLEFSPSASV